MTSDICVTMCAVISVFCEIRCFSFVSLLNKKAISKTLDPDMSIVSSNIKSEIPAKRDLGWVRRVFLCNWTLIAL